MGRKFCWCCCQNPLKISWVSGPSGSQNGGGYIRLNQIVSGSGGTANKITLIFNANGGSGTMSNQTVTYGVTTHLKKCTLREPIISLLVGIFIVMLMTNGMVIIQITSKDGIPNLKSSNILL